MSGEPIDVNDGNFDDIMKKNNTLIVDCWAPWCGPCRMMSPVVDAVSKELDGKVVFGKLNTDENPHISQRYTIEAIPTLLVFKDGELIDRWVGARTKEDLKKRVQSLL